MWLSEGAIRWTGMFRVLASRLFDPWMINSERYRQLVAANPARGMEIVGEHQLMPSAVASGHPQQAAQGARIYRTCPDSLSPGAD